MHFFFLYKEKKITVEEKNSIEPLLWALLIEDPMSLVNNLFSIVHSADAINKRFSSLACSVAFFYLYTGHHARTRVSCIADNGFGIIINPFSLFF